MKQKFKVILLGEVWDLPDAIDENSKDKHLRKVGTERRDEYEQELRLDLLDGEFKIA